MWLCIFSKRDLTTMRMIYNQYIVNKTETQSKLRLSWFSTHHLEILNTHTHSESTEA